MDLPQFRNFSLELQFLLRKNLFSKLKLRPGLPQIPFPEIIQDQNGFYERVLSIGFKDTDCHAVENLIDIGCSNWSYVQILSKIFPNADLTGIEVDGGRRYWNLHRRIDLARAFVKNLKLDRKNVQVIQGDFREIEILFSSKSVLFCSFFPFVSDNPCHKWGLPLRFADFKSLLSHSLKLTKDNQLKAQWFSVHQGDWEGTLAQETYHLLGLPVQLEILAAADCSKSWHRPYDTWIFRTL